MITVQTTPVRWQNGRFTPSAAPQGREGTMAHAILMAHNNVVGLAQQLPGQLRAALADGHTAVSPVSGMGIGAQNHPAGRFYCAF